MIIAAVGLLIAAALAFSYLGARRFEARFPPTGALIETALGRVHVARRDPVGAAKATILLIHGASGNQADLMAPLGEGLTARGFRVLAVDRPGHGYSDRLRENPASPAAQARAIRAAIEAAGVKKAIVVGHSWAGAVAASFALDHADFTDAIVLLAPVTHPWPRGIRWYYKLADIPVAGWLFAHLLLVPFGLASMPSALAGVFKPQPAPPDYAERTGAVLAIRPRVFRANAQDIVELRGNLEIQAPRMPAIACPVAILTGDHDSVVLTELHCHRSAREISGATLRVLPGVGHSPHWADPQATIETIAEVAARVQSAREILPRAEDSAPSTSSQ